jgi:anti-sigma regulatory factor (Ser/Thr protein kinase)
MDVGGDDRMALDLSLRPGLRAPAEARRSLSEGFGNLDPDTLSRLRLLVTELVTNSVRHAGLAENDSIVLSVRHAEDRIRVAVTDPGGGFRPALPPQPDVERPAGWGLYLVDRLADRWGVTSDGETLVWFELDC